MADNEKNKESNGNEAQAFKEGQESSKQKQDSPHSIVTTLLDTEKETEARERGFEAEQNAQSLAKKLNEGKKDDE